MFHLTNVCLVQFADSSFDVVLDKGSLDALTGEPEEPQIAAQGLLSEVCGGLVYSNTLLGTKLAFCKLGIAISFGYKLPET